MIKVNCSMDLSTIPKRGKSYDWKNSIDCKCRFVYEDINGEVEIVEYNNTRHITIKYKDKIKEIAMSSFLNGMIGGLLNVRTTDFKINIGTDFIGDKRNITIIDREYRSDKSGKSLKWYKYKCNICTFDYGWHTEDHILKEIGCSCCSGHICVKGINDIATKHPELVKYFVNAEDSYNTTCHNRTEYLMKCPNCGNTKLLTTEKLSSRGYACEECGDGSSYGEKYLYSLLSQLNINFIVEYNRTSSKWCNNYRYDYYILSKNMIIEVHGLQHYQTSRKSSGKYRGFEEEHINDLAKEKLAKENNIDNYIVIDARKSESEFIKNSILQSKLPELFDFNENDIDWNKCIEYTATSKVVEVCNYKNNHMELSTVKISEVFKVHSCTIQKYLQRGAKLGICLYNLEDEKIKIYTDYRNDDFRLYPIYCREINTYFKSSYLCEEYGIDKFKISMNSASIRKSIRNNKIYKGFTFNYITQHEFNIAKQQLSPELVYGDSFNLPTQSA